MSAGDGGGGLAVAVIGMAGRFPGAPDVGTFWRNLRAGVESIRRFSVDELVSAGVPEAHARHPNYVPAKGMLDGADRFDAAFFGISPREAELIDPQHRIFLETAWHALEDAGCDPARYPGRIGVYAGCNISSYLLRNLWSRAADTDPGAFYQALIANDKDFLATQVAYRLDLRGPAVVISTTCSTSLVAIHIASQAVLGGECDMALAGGISIALPSQSGYFAFEGDIGAPDGRCRPFDREARGTVSGEGIGVVVIKRLEDALADGDFVYAVIKGSAINNDGGKKVGFTAPSVDGQVHVIRAACAVADVDPATISFIETHGTGTAVGDPIEFTALCEVLPAHLQHHCALGAVKASIGHLDAAAGVAGLIKAVLALHHGEIPPQINYQAPNPRIALEQSPFFINTEAIEWPRTATPRRAGVTSLGVGGTNAHVVLEEAPPRAAGVASGPEVIALSAKTAAALAQAGEQLADALAANPELSLEDVSATLQLGRRHFEHRLAIVNQDRADTIAALREPAGTRAIVSTPIHDDLPVIFLFPGQGAQHLHMGAGLYASEPEFRDVFDHCARICGEHAGVDLKQLLHAAHANAAAAEARLQQTAIAQPALFAIEYALARLWMSWGVPPRAMIGHSVGEYVAACLAGVFSLDDAVRLVAARGRLVQQLPPGAMLAVALSEAALQPLLRGELAIAAVNAPEHAVASGPTSEIDALERELAERGVSCRRLRTSHAFHSGMMQPALDVFGSMVAKLSLGPPSIPFVSNLTGDWISAERAQDPRYWAAHLRGTVQFMAGAERLLASSDAALLEVGPGATLGALVRKQAGFRAARHAVVASLSRAPDPAPDASAVREAAARLWTAGVAIDWRALHRGRVQKVPLPGYPFQRLRYWIEPRAAAPSGADGGAPAVAPAAATSPRYARPPGSAAYAAPGSDLERRLVEIWSELLRIDRVGIHDDFLELGGDSLLMTRLLTKLNTAFEIAMPLETLFHDRTIARQARTIELRIIEQIEASVSDAV